MITTILLALTAIIASLAGFIASRPGHFRIARRISIAAPAGLAFDQVNDLHLWQEMSPYVKLDPDAKYTFTGPRAGAGASLAWEGNKKVGAGRMTVVESQPNELVRMKLEFFQPFAATHEARFTFQEKGGETEATWSMTRASKFMCKAFGLIMNMDKMIGDQFEEGLAQMKANAERKATLTESRPDALAVASF